MSTVRPSVRLPAALVPLLDAVATDERREYRTSTRHSVAVEAFRRGLLAMAAEKKIGVVENTRTTEDGPPISGDGAEVGTGTIG